MLAAAAIAAAAAFAVIVRVGPDPAAPVAGGPGAAELAEALDFDDLADSFALEELEWVDAALAEDELSGLDDLLDSSQGEGPI